MAKPYNGITRRELLTATAIAGLTPSWISLAEATTEKISKINPIVKPIPTTGELLPVIGLGTSRTFDVGSAESTRSVLQEALQIFFRSGGTLIDSSPMYGAAEQVTGDLLKNINKKMTLFAATKVWTNGRQEGIDQMNQSFRKMGVETMDLMQIHNLRDWKTHIKTLREWKEKGKIRHIGITTSHGRSHTELETILKQEKFDFVQLSYNVLDRGVEEKLLPLAYDKGIAVLANRPFQRGQMFKKVKNKPLPGWAEELNCNSWAQLFLKFVVSHPAVTCAIPATAKPHHMMDNMGAGFGALPDITQRKKIIDLLS